MKYQKNYNDIIISVINNTQLSETEERTLLNCLKCHNKDVLFVFEDMYKLYLNDYSLIELSEIYNRSARTIQTIFKNIGLNRDRFQAQKIGAKKRNYVDIRKTFKKTMTKRFVDNQLFGSKIEQFVRFQFNLTLCELINNAEIIVGINTVTKVGELDIPIIILCHNKIYKYGIEVDNKYFHNDKRKRSDINKSYNLNLIGYKIFHLETKAYFSSKNTYKVIYENEIN